MHFSQLSHEGKLLKCYSLYMNMKLLFTSQAASAVQELPKYGEMDRTAVQILPKCSRPVVSLQLMLFVMSVSKYKFPLKSDFTALVFIL